MSGLINRAVRSATRRLFAVNARHELVQVGEIGESSPVGEPLGLIFDFGLHRGFDSAFYLRKGFKVVGVEAVPTLCDAARSKLETFGGNFIAVNRALAERCGETTTFYSVPGKDDWGSLEEGNAGKGIYETVPIEIETTNLSQLFDIHGTPYYIKCDLEGADRMFVQQLLEDQRRPTFVSVEINHSDDIDVLAKCGYELGQIVNQAMNVNVKAPNPPREGVFVDARFDGETSGLFGRDLPADKWHPLDEAKQMYLDWRALKQRDDNLAPGWLDIHVCRRSALQ